MWVAQWNSEEEAIRISSLLTSSCGKTQLLSLFYLEEKVFWFSSSFQSPTSPNRCPPSYPACSRLTLTFESCQGEICSLFHIWSCLWHLALLFLRTWLWFTPLKLNQKYWKFIKKNVVQGLSKTKAHADTLLFLTMTMTQWAPVSPHGAYTVFVSLVPWWSGWV